MMLADQKDHEGVDPLESTFADDEKWAPGQTIIFCLAVSGAFWLGVALIIRALI